MKNVLVMCLILFIVACAGLSYDEKLSNYIDKTEKELISSIGVPDGSYEIKEEDGTVTKILTYNGSSNQYIPDPYRMDKPLSGGFITKNCRTRFAIQNDIVVAYRYSGNGCR